MALNAAGQAGTAPGADPEHRPVPVPGLADVKLDDTAKEHLQKVLEIGRDGDIGEVEALALHDVGGEAGRRVH